MSDADTFELSDVASYALLSFAVGYVLYEQLIQTGLLGNLFRNAMAAPSQSNYAPPVSNSAQPQPQARAQVLPPIGRATPTQGPHVISGFGEQFIKNQEEEGGIPALTRYNDVGHPAIAWGHDI